MEITNDTMAKSHSWSRKDFSEPFRETGRYTEPKAINTSIS